MKMLREMLIEKGLDPDPKPRKRPLRWLKGDRVIPGVPLLFKDIVPDTTHSGVKAGVGNARAAYWPIQTASRERRPYWLTPAVNHMTRIAAAPVPLLEYIALFDELNNLKPVVMEFRK